MRGSKSILEREKILDQCAAIFCVSEYIRKQFLDGIEANQNKVYVLHNGVDRKIKKLPVKKKEVLFVGRLVLEKGVEGYLTRECDEDEIIHAIFAIAKGEKFYCNKVMDIILNKQYNPEDNNCEPTTLTQRETEITALIAKGMTNKSIAEQLHLSPHTVHTHRKNILRKLGINSVSELTLYAINIGLIESDSFRID